MAPSSVVFNVTEAGAIVMRFWPVDLFLATQVVELSRGVEENVLELHYWTEESTLEGQCYILNEEAFFFSPPSPLQSMSEDWERGNTG